MAHSTLRTAVDQVTGVAVVLGGCIADSKTSYDDPNANSLSGVLAAANNIGDILAVHDRIAAVKSMIDQLQGEINGLGNQASLSSLALLFGLRYFCPVVRRSPL